MCTRERREGGGEVSRNDYNRPTGASNLELGLVYFGVPKWKVKAAILRRLNPDTAYRCNLLQQKHKIKHKETKLSIGKLKESSRNVANNKKKKRTR